MNRSTRAALDLAADLHRQGRPAEAAEQCRRALGEEPANPVALNLLGTIEGSLGRLDEAARCFAAALARDPKLAEAHGNLGIAYFKLGREADAVASLTAAVAIKPDYCRALIGLGRLLTRLGRFDEAAARLTAAAAIEPRNASTHNLLGIALKALGRHEDALACYRKAAALDPRLAPVHHNLGNLLRLMQRPDEALASYEAALELAPDDALALNSYSYLLRQTCTWHDVEAVETRLRGQVERGRGEITPFSFLTVTDDPAAQLACARNYAAHRGFAKAPIVAKRRAAKDRLRIAYVSGDFRDHPVAYLTARLFELHDRTRFEVVAFSYGADDGGAMRRRLGKAFDQFVDCRDEASARIADRIAAMEVDIAIDLMGHTRDNRLEILARRPAPVQVHYLGYPGTLGVDFIDYTIADRFVVPEDQQRYFAEKIVYLPGSFQVNDALRSVSDRRFTRAECGLPDRGFVFCSFNQGYKISPAIFAIWMRLLDSVPGSVLWLSAVNRVAEENLRREAVARGVDPGRLAFARRLDLRADHLARHRVADLFLDTLPYNAHTTACDALAAGLPVLTCAGRSLAARVAGSLLHAVGLPELVTGDLGAYERLALRLATDPDELNAIRGMLAANLTTATLFDCERTTRQIEAAYREMWAIHRRGEAPRSFAVEASPGPGPD